jgi:histidine triad (HIT) family protein
MSDCIFCKIVRGEIPSHKIYEDEEFIAFLDIHPVQRGHVLIIPKEHVDYVFDMNEELYHKMFELAKDLSRKLKHVTNAVKIGIVIEGLAVRHVHLHLIPVNHVNDIDPCKSQHADHEDLKNLTESLRQ